MASVARQTQYRRSPLNQAGVIRKVFRRDGKWTCSICRGQHEEQTSAISCLQRCWEDYLTMPPVITRGAMKRYVHRCRFCARDYSEFSDATRCAEQCRSELMAQNQRDLDSLKSALPPPPKRNIPKRAPAPQLVMVPTAKPKPVVATPEPAATPDPVIADAAPEPAQEPVYDEAPAEARSAKPDEKFYRDNAKYACTVCNERYFTKVEVEACYDAHP